MSRWAIYQFWGNKEIYRGEYASKAYAMKLARKHKKMQPGYQTFVQEVVYKMVPVGNGKNFQVYN